VTPALIVRIEVEGHPVAFLDAAEPFAEQFDCGYPTAHVGDAHRDALLLAAIAARVRHPVLARGAQGGVKQRLLDLVERRRCFRQRRTHPCWIADPLSFTTGVSTRPLVARR
jgi:hypothetical protein